MVAAGGNNPANTMAALWPMKSLTVMMAIRV